MAGNKFWTDDRVQMLRDLWGKDHTTAQIAKAIGGVTKNAVAGIGFRLKLGPVNNINRRRIEKPSEDATQEKRRLRVKARAEAFRNEVVAIVAPPVEAMDNHDWRKPIGKPIPLARLNHRSCRYPFGNPQSDDFGYCGETIREGSVYCADHHRLCYVPLSRRSDVSKEQERAFA